MKRSVPLEDAAVRVCEEAAVPPLIFRIPPEEGRLRLEKAQDSPVFMFPASVSSVEVDTGEWGSVRVFVVRPQGQSSARGAIFYIHGAGWVFGSFHTHEKLVRELCARTNRVVVFPEYSRSPEAQYPTAIEQCFFVLCNMRELLDAHAPGTPLDDLVAAGDSVGGNMTAAMSFLSADRGGPYIKKQLLYYPVTDARFDTPSYRQFASGYYLYRAEMMWFWQQYAPRISDRAKITASPLRASKDELSVMPETMVICGEADVLRDEGESFAARLLLAGVSVTSIRVNGIIHDFVMLNSLNETNACRAAMDASTAWINARR